MDRMNILTEKLKNACPSFSTSSALDSETLRKKIPVRNHLWRDEGWADELRSYFALVHVDH